MLLRDLLKMALIYPRRTLPRSLALSLPHSHSHTHTHDSEQYLICFSGNSTKGWKETLNRGEGLPVHRKWIKHNSGKLTSESLWVCAWVCEWEREREMNEWRSERRADQVAGEQLITKKGHEFDPREQLRGKIMRRCVSPSFQYCAEYMWKCNMLMRNVTD